MAVVPGGRDVPRSHAEIVAAITSYAAGLLTGRAEDVVRLHLAGGCRECLDHLFRRPVGLPRAASGAPTTAHGALRVVSAVLVVIALMGTVLASTMWLTAGAPSSAARGLGGGRMAALEAHASEARERLASLAARSIALERHLGPLAPGLWAERGATPRRAESAATEQALAQLGAALAVPLTRVARLRAERAPAGAWGWLIWDPLRGRLFVYAVGLPRLVAPWEAHVTAGSDVRRVPLRRLADGSLWGIVDRVGEPACEAHVSIVPPRADRTVLAGDVPACGPGLDPGRRGSVDRPLRNGTDAAHRERERLLG